MQRPALAGMPRPGSVVPTTCLGQNLRFRRPGSKANDGWAIDPIPTEALDRDSVQCYRSYDFGQDKPTDAGQNCCYDRAGKLLNQGPLAGTPYKVNICVGEEADGTMILDPALLRRHLEEDVRPRRESGKSSEGWLTFQKENAPNRGLRCPANGVLPKSAEAERPRIGFPAYQKAPVRPSDKKP